MYYVIGLKEDGRMVLYSYSDGMPNTSDLANELESFDYTQVLIVTGGRQVKRYEYGNQPRLKDVGLA